jgi:hypothetical protein
LRREKEKGWPQFDKKKNFLVIMGFTCAEISFLVVCTLHLIKKKEK